MSEVRIVRVGRTAHSSAVQLSESDDDPVVKVVNPPIGFNPRVVNLDTGFGHRSGERWWHGEGDPPDYILGAQIGDFYWDELTGDVFELVADTP